MRQLLFAAVAATGLALCATHASAAPAYSTAPSIAAESAGLDLSQEVRYRRHWRRHHHHWRWHHRCWWRHGMRVCR